jgi:hypothetical protein
MVAQLENVHLGTLGQSRVALREWVYVTFVTNWLSKLWIILLSFLWCLAWGCNHLTLCICLCLTALEHKAKSQHLYIYRAMGKGAHTPTHTSWWKSELLCLQPVHLLLCCLICYVLHLIFFVSGVKKGPLGLLGDIWVFKKRRPFGLSLVLPFWVLIQWIQPSQL